VLNPKEQEALLKSKLHELQATTAFKRAQKIQLAWQFNEKTFAIT